MARKRKYQRHNDVAQLKKFRRAIPILPAPTFAVLKDVDEKHPANNVPSDIMKVEEVAAMEKNNSFSAVSEETKRSIYEECRKMLTGPFMQQRICAVCDSWTRENVCPLRENDEDLYSRCRNRLSPSSDLPDSLKQFYDVSTYIPQLRHTLLSKKGIKEDSNIRNSFRIRVCNSCYSSLKRGETFENKNPPKFSIANGFSIGMLPKHLNDTTVTEKRLTSLTNIKGHTVIARGGKHRFIKSHFLVFSSQPDIIKQGINELIKEEDKLLIIFTNPMTDAQKKATMKRYQARKQKINDLFNFYMENNTLYKDQDINNKDINRLRNISSTSQSELDEVNTVYNIDDHMSAKDISDNQSNIRRPTVFDRAQNANEEILIRQDTSLFTREDAAEPITALQMATARVIDVQQAGKFLPASSKNFFGRLFPHLFPFGHGHPDASRKVCVSLQECVKYYLRLSSRQFAQDETFPLIAFDIVSRKRAMSHISLTCKLNPKEIEALNEVSASDLAGQLQQETRRRENLKNGHTFTEQTKSRSGKRLLRRVQAVLGKTFATNEERKIYQRKAWSMAAKFHSAAMFITVTPNENGNATVAFFAGDINKENLLNITQNDIPCNASRIEIAGRDPVACDLFFSNILEILIGPMIGFDMKTKLPRKQGGLFGVPKAFVGGIESQGKGTLHVHIIVFLAGFPKDSEEILSLLKTNKEFKDRLFSFINSVTESSAIKDERELECPECNSKGTIKPIKIHKIAYSRNIKFDAAPKTSECKKCQKRFGGDAIIRHNLKQMETHLTELLSQHGLKNDSSAAISLNVNKCVRESDIEHDNKVAIKVAVPQIPVLPNKSSSREDILVHAIFLIELLLLNQKHRWKHAASCFKKSAHCKDGCCRHNFPRLVQLMTEIDDLGRITGQRVVGSEYINAFNAIILQVVRSNHDVRFILCCAHEIYYTIKYVVKDQNTIDNIAAITIASYTKRLQRENTKNNDISVTRTVYGRIASMAYARSDLIEVGAVTAVHYLLHGTTFVCSHEFQSLHLGRHLNDLDEIEGDVGIVPHGNSYIAFDVTSNYKLRPLELENTCLYNYTESFFLSRDIPQDIDTNPDCMRLHENHPFFASKIVKKRKIKVIADIIGPRIPDLYNISKEEMEMYSKIALLLFKPHRSRENILQNFESFTEAFNEFRNDILYKNSQAELILSNMQQYYIGKRRAHEMKIEQLEKWEQEHENGIESDASGAENDDIDILDGSDDDNQGECASSDLSNISSKLDPETVKIILENVVDKMNNQAKVRTSQGEKDFCSPSGMRTVVKRCVRKEENIKAFHWPVEINAHKSTRLLSKDVEAAYDIVKSVHDNCSNSEKSDDNPSSKLFIQESVVRLLEEAIKSALSSNDLSHVDKSLPNIAQLINPSLDQVAWRFTLNKRHSIAFKIAGSYLLDSFKRSLLRDPPGKPLRMHLSGEGGTGKSRVVDALRFLAIGWGKPDAVVTVAPTGIAAVLVNGETVHSKLQIFHSKKPTMKQLEEWSKVYMLIWDEISMTGQSLFAKAIKKIKTFLGTEKENDARIHIVTSGDFAQLPPCFEKFIFSPPAYTDTNLLLCVNKDETKTESNTCRSYSKKSNVNVNNITGFHIWQSFKTVVKLNENMRHLYDPSYGNILKRLRTGDQTIQDFKILNSRFLDPLNSNCEVQKQFMKQQESNASFPIAVQANLSRHSINWLSTSVISQSSSENEIPIICPAQFSAAKRGAKPTMEQLEHLFHLGDNKLQRLSPLLPIFPGMPVYITQNICPKIGLANGSTGSILGCQFPENATFRKVSIKGAPMKIASTLPEIVFVSLKQAKVKTRFPTVPEIYPDNTIPILPYSVTVRVSSLRNRIFSIKITQIPISPSFSATTHKLQGTTYDAILSYVLNEPGRQPTSLYVLASRVKTLKGLFLCQKLTDEDFKFFRPSQEVLDEENRLEILWQKTLKSFSNGTIFPDEVNKEIQEIEHVEEKDPRDIVIDLYPTKHKRRNEKNLIHDSTDFPKRKKSKNHSYELSKSCFEVLVPHFDSQTVRRMKLVHELMVTRGFGASALPIAAFIQHNVIPHPTLWRIVDVPSDGNCWIYATVLSIYYCTSIFRTYFSLDPQDCRNEISSLLLEISRCDDQKKINFLRNMNLSASQRGIAIRRVSNELGYRNSLHMMSSFLKVGAPHTCLWAGDIGEELSLLSIILNQRIICYSFSPSRTCSLGIDSTIGTLYPTSVYFPYPDTTSKTPVVPFQIPILFSNGNHFKTLIPPSGFDIFTLPFHHL